MTFINYRNYTIEELLDAKASIDREAYPENYAALKKELESRENEIAIYQKEQIKREYKNTKLLVKIAGSFQILTAVVFILFFFISSYTSIEYIVQGIFILLNAIAGYTALKTIRSYYWLSILNQSMQVLSFTIGSIVINYSGLVAFSAILTWQEGFTLLLAFSFDPGYKFWILDQPSTSGNFSIDIIAVIILAIFFVASRDIEAINKGPG